MTSTPACSNSDDDPPILELELDPTPDAPSLARAAIVGFCQDCAVSSSALATVMLLVSEIVTNAVIHPDAKPPAPVRMRAGVTPEVIRVEIKDQGSGFTPQPRDPSRSQGGYGLYLLDKEALHWGVRQHQGNTVWFEVSSGATGETGARQAQRREHSPQPAAGAGPPPPMTRMGIARARPTVMTAAPSAADYHAPSPPPLWLRTCGAQHEPSIGRSYASRRRVCPTSLVVQRPLTQLHRLRDVGPGDAAQADTSLGTWRGRGWSAHSGRTSCSSPPLLLWSGAMARTPQRPPLPCA